MLCDWLKNLAPLSRPIRSKTKSNRSRFPALHAFGSSSDWFIELSVCIVIGQSDYFGFVYLRQITLDNVLTNVTKKLHFQRGSLSVVLTFLHIR